MDTSNQVRPIFSLLLNITEDGWTAKYVAPNHGSTEMHGNTEGFDTTDRILRALTDILHDLRGTNTIE